MMADWYLYIIKCGNGTLYTGIATDVLRRFAEHRESGAKAAKYLKGRGPLQLIFNVKIGPRGLALKLEHKIKRLSKAQKEALIEDPQKVEILARLF